ncbi:autophagy protein Apg9 [Pseudomassariella vexata]|uniref:Autophagy-related protein 9 n=1 Tax=Pseudomassariella vexata TaxID=1141098 RepID=A0A1Y2E6E3_9PEZI|nr:autophagy protein Apg9 [Pseudomassariella vexata]ORY67092.1 autophagy protein Apg9 [Pseudomassariella vexata]
MAGNLFSRLVPGRDDDRSYYDQLADDDVDIENRAGLALDEENLNHQFYEDDLAIEDSRISTASVVPPLKDGRRGQQGKRGRPEAGSRWLAAEDDGENEVPASLLVEPGMNTAAARQNPRRSGPQPNRQPVPGPSNRRTQAQWETAQAQQRLHQDDEYGRIPKTAQSTTPQRLGVFNPKEKAMFRWANVSNLDIFINDVYAYYLGAGIWCILLDRALHLLKGIFIASLLTLLTQCVDYSKLRESKSMSQIMIPKCTKNMWGIWNLGLWLCSFYVIWKSIQFVLDIPRLLHIRDFYIHLLEIPEEDMQTVSWQDVVSRITGLRDQNVRTATHFTPSQRRFLSQQTGRQVGQAKERLDAHDIANRLMRRENYIIALFNKDTLDLTAGIPFLRHRPFFSRTLLWTLQFSILDLVFNESNQVHQRILKSDHRGQLSRELRTRFAFAATMNLILAPFVAAFLMIDFIFTYFHEFKTNTASAGTRQYTPLAEWKFREFNELPHLFKERLNMSYPYAKHYIDQFPKMKTELAAQTVRFFAGALIAVLAIVGFSDPEMFVDFEILPGFNAFAFLAVCTTTFAVAQGMISEENDVFDPEYAMRNVIEYTHHEPEQWQGRLHSYDVKIEFAELYKLKIVIFLEEILGILVTPLVLFISLPKCADQIIDFFREFTIHVDGLGYVCSFAVFDFKKDPRNARQANTMDAREDYYATKHNKMQASVHGFLDNYVYNPRSGLPGNPLGPAGRHQFHPPPAFPGLNSPTLAADMRASRLGHSERPRSRAPPASQQSGKTPRFGPALPQPSPMASMLLDPHHQPSASLIAARGAQRARQQRAPYLGEAGITEESMEGTVTRNRLQRQGTTFTDEEVEESVARLGESTWDGSPGQGLSRENSAVAMDGDDGPGVVKLLKQFQQAHMNPRGGGVL